MNLQRLTQNAGTLLLLISVTAQMAPASGTPADTIITNQASVVYNAGSETRYDSSNVVTPSVLHLVENVDLTTSDIGGTPACGLTPIRWNPFPAGTSSAVTHLPGEVRSERGRSEIR